ncbi:MAG TPA: FixH family protein [Kofleriaceae bacterium]|nr:FixH family protein [Kofleriaceae bacterium]
MSRTLRSILVPLAAASATIAAGAGLVVSCSSSPSGPTGGDVAGAEDMHCVADDGGLITQSTSQSGCTYRPPPDAPPPPPEAGAPDAPPEESDYGATMYNADGYDDDCKYHVTWTSTAIRENTNVYFHVVATVAGTTTPVTGANIYAEVFLSDTHEAPPTNQSAVEMPTGTYKVGPIQFDAPGTWTVRFHLFENCLDYADDSPHGHAAFYVDVP